MQIAIKICAIKLLSIIDICVFFLVIEQVIVKYDRALLIGRWFRADHDEKNRKVVEYAQLSADGSFEFTFVTYEQTPDNITPGLEQITEQVTELGDWGLVADIHFTITKNEVVDEHIYAADLNDSDNYHAYRVIQLDHHTFAYQHIETNEIFTMRRITDDIGHC